MGAGTYENAWTPELQHYLASKHAERIWKCRPGDIADFCYTAGAGDYPE